MSNELRIAVQPDWREMDGINAKAMEFLGSASLPEAIVDTYTMVICELLENSIKYGLQNEAIELAVSVDHRFIKVQVTNKVDRDSRPHLRQMDRTLQRIRGAQDPYQAYVERVREISREPLGNTRSGLGLVRIAYEGGADIDFILNDDDTLNVSAMARLA